MPKMQVTFKNASRGAAPGKGRNVELPTSVLSFQIEYRGKTYDCVGHLRPKTEEKTSETKIEFSGFYGYNGPIDIEKLRNAAEDYYQAVSSQAAPELRIVREGNDGVSLIAHQEFDLQENLHKSYEFNVGRLEQLVWQKAG